MSKSSGKMPKSTKEGSWNPMAVFVAGLFLVQLVIFNLGMNFVHRSETAPETDNRPQQVVSDTTPRNNIPTKIEPRKPIPDDPTADAHFQGYPVHLRQKANPSTLPHCVGENYQNSSWQQRSCRFEFFCFDMASKEFVVYQPKEETSIYTFIERNPHVDVSQSYIQFTHNKTIAVSLGGINLKWGNGKDGVDRLIWTPKIVSSDDYTTDSPLTFYELPSSVVLAPFHSMNGANPGHLVWDDFLPIYTLLTMFQLDEQSDVLFMRYILKDGRGLWASCDWNDEKTSTCAKMHKKFLPLMLGPDAPTGMATTNDYLFQTKDGQEAKSSLVCAKNGVAGIGSLTDHGTRKLHGWEEKDYRTTHNHGRGGMLYEFRNYMMSNIGVQPFYEHIPPFRIVFSLKSSNIPSRDIDFSKQIEALKQNFDPNLVKIETYVFKDVPLVEQVEIASQTTIFITGAGGGAVTATFLPRGASVFLYFLERGGVEGGRDTGKPARLDWDLFNNLGYLKVHWLPIGTMNNGAHIQSLVMLVQHELDALIRERSYDKFFS